MSSPLQHVMLRALLLNANAQHSSLCFVTVWVPPHRCPPLSHSETIPGSSQLCCCPLLAHGSDPHGVWLHLWFQSTTKVFSTSLHSNQQHIKGSCNSTARLGTIFHLEQSFCFISSLTIIRSFCKTGYYKLLIFLPMKLALWLKKRGTLSDKDMLKCLWRKEQGYGVCFRNSMVGVWYMWLKWEQHKKLQALMLGEKNKKGGCAMGTAPEASPKGWHAGSPPSQPYVSQQLEYTQLHFSFPPILDIAIHRGACRSQDWAVLTRCHRGPAAHRPHSPKSTPLQWQPRPGNGGRRNGQRFSQCFWRQDPGPAVGPKRLKIGRRSVSRPRTMKQHSSPPLCIPREHTLLRVN